MIDVSPGGRSGKVASARSGVAVRLLSVAAFLVVSGAQPLAHETARDGDPTNDWIERLSNAIAQNCCGENDCSPLGSGDLLSLDSGGFRAMIGGNWHNVPDHAIVRDASPDGRPWVCEQREAAPPGSYRYIVVGVRCLLLPRLA